MEGWLHGEWDKDLNTFFVSRCERLKPSKAGDKIASMTKIDGNSDKLNLDFINQEQGNGTVEVRDVIKNDRSIEMTVIHKTSEKTSEFHLKISGSDFRYLPR